MKDACNMTCPICHQPFVYEDKETVTVIPIGDDRLFVHRACLEKRVREFKLCDEEKELISGILDDYLEQEKYADLLDISRDELIRQIENILKR
jgi:hypothetical protein